MTQIQPAAIAEAAVVGKPDEVEQPDLFSNSLAPPIVNATIKVIDLISGGTERRDKLEWNQRHFRQQPTRWPANTGCNPPRILRSDPKEIQAQSARAQRLRPSLLAR